MSKVSNRNNIFLRIELLLNSGSPLLNVFAVKANRLRVSFSDCCHLLFYGSGGKSIFKVKCNEEMSYAPTYPTCNMSDSKAEKDNLIDYFNVLLAGFRIAFLLPIKHVSC